MLTFTGNTANFESWYKYVKSYTPESSMLLVSEAERMVLKAKGFDYLSKEIPYFGETNTRANTSEWNEEDILNQLIQRIDHQLQGKTCFFRTNLFSPKDVKPSCLVSTGEEVVELMIASFRLYRGFPLLKDMDFYLVFREVVHFKEEFRCFVQDGEVVGISQYDDSDSITKGEGASKIYDLTNWDYLEVYHYLEKIMKDSKINTAVIDIGKTDFGLMLIELNPFHESTDKSLFANTSIYSPEWRPTQIRYWVEKDLLRIVTLEFGSIQRITEEKVEIVSEEDNYLSELVQQLNQRITTDKRP